ncbi:MAG: polymer-forming cytoskeletal protein [Desulfobacterales bacterium]|jgi:cytoskeletal protein CcmA (bactofilin family)
MKKRNGKDAASDSITTFLGSGARIEGLLDFEGTVRLDGHIDGKITGREGTLIIGESAVIKADISVGRVIAMGEIHGSVQAKERIELFPPGKIHGDVEAPVITIEAGAVLNGQCMMKNESPSLTKGSAPSPAGDTKKIETASSEA